MVGDAMSGAACTAGYVLAVRTLLEVCMCLPHHAAVP